MTPPPRRRRRHAQPVSVRRSLYEWSAMALLLSASTVGVVLFGAVRNWSAGSLMVLVFLGGFLFLLRPFLDRDLSELRIPPGGLLSLMFLLYAGILMPLASVPYEAKVELLKIGSYIVAYWAWTELASRYRRWRILLGIPLFLGTLVALYAIIQHVQGSNMVLNMERHAQYEMRASGTFMAPAHLGAFLGTLLCLAACLIPMHAAGPMLRLLAGYGFILFLPVLFLSESRSGWVGATVGLSVVALLLLWRKSLRAFCIALVAIPLIVGALVGGLWAVSPMFKERVSSALAVEGTAGHRIAMWQDTWQMIQDKPVLGHGPGSYRWLYPKYQSWQADRWLRYAHNEYLHLWAEYGLVGLLLMTAILGTVIARCLWVYRRIERGRDACLLAGFLGALCAALAHAMFDFNLHVFALVHLLVLFGGVTMGGLFSSGNLKVRAVPFAVWGLVGALAGLAVLVSALVSLQFTASAALVRLGEAKEPQVDVRSMTIEERARSNYKRAARMDSSNWVPHLELGDIARREAFWIRDPVYREEKAREALAHYQRARELNAFDMNVVYGIGRCWLLLGDREKSLDYLQRAVDNWPTNLFYARQLGLQLREAGRLEEALAVFHTARRLAPQDTMVLTNIRLLEQQLQPRAEPATP